MSKQKYPLSNFYVGELYLSYEYKNLLTPEMYSENMNKKLEIQMKTLKNGAIDFQNTSFIRQYINWQQGKKQTGVLTIFYKENNNYICLHNGQSYTLDGEDYPKNLISLTSLLPQIDFNIPCNLTVPMALSLFDQLFAKDAKKNLITRFNNSIFDTQKFYVGNLNLCTGFSDNKSKTKYQYYNLARRYILYKSTAHLGSMFGIDAYLDDDLGTYHYDSFKCLFLKLSHNQLYNINNFQMYSNEIIDNLDPKSDLIGESYIEWLTPFNEVLDNNGIRVPGKITIPKALKLYKKTN